jgi:hypothetical protein
MKWTCSLVKRKTRKNSCFVVFASSAAILLAGPGCGQMAKLAYFTGAGRDTKVEPEYKLPKNVLLVLVDDPAERVAWPEVRRALAEDVGETLLTQKAVEKVVRPQAVMKMRQADSEFEKLSATAVGEKVGADTVLWLEVSEFFAPQEIQDTASAARMTLSVKVLDVHQKDASDKVRLWPKSSSGHIVETQLKAVEVQKLKGNIAVARELARKAAVAVSRLFYQHTLGELDDDS